MFGPEICARSSQMWAWLGTDVERAWNHSFYLNLSYYVTTVIVAKHIVLIWKCKTSRVAIAFNYRVYCQYYRTFAIFIANNNDNIDNFIDLLLRIKFSKLQTMINFNAFKTNTKIFENTNNDKLMNISFKNPLKRIISRYFRIESQNSARTVF